MSEEKDIVTELYERSKSDLRYSWYFTDEDADALARAAAEIERLRKALEPFASEYIQRLYALGVEPDSAAVFRTAYRIMVGDLRRAHVAWGQK